MTHDEIQELLEGYVDETLDRPTRRLVDEHLATCEECRAIIDHVEPVDLTVLSPAGFDEQAMRRMVRRSIFRIAVDTVLILFAGLVTVWLLSVFVFHPLVINRGGRAADAVRAAMDMTTMVNPGVVVTGGDTQSQLLSRRIELDLVLPVGSGSQEVGPVAYRLGAFSLTDDSGAPPVPFLDPGDFLSAGADQIARLGAGTVAAVRVDYTSPITINEAQAVADSADHDIRVVWAGFDIRSVDDPFQPFLDVVGYATCLRSGDVPDDETLQASSAGFSRGYTSTFSPASITTALSSTREGLKRILDSTELTSAFLDRRPGTEEAARKVLDLLTESDPAVRTLVITGPSPEISAFLSDPSTPENVASVLAVDFYNWATPVCGR